MVAAIINELREAAENGSDLTEEEEVLKRANRECYAGECGSSDGEDAFVAY
jgi:hypothetical protein